uniref:Uncharacterized protein n=1 Tax=Anguilla anguilla TaxID=7936 RepID=A0A0E9UEN9_ANGAN
MFIMVCFYTN